MQNLNKKNILILLAIVIFLGGVLRLYNLSNRGLYYYDEGFYLNGGRTVYSVFLYLMDKLNVRTDKKLTDYISSESGGYLTGAKPGYYFMIFLAYYVFGIKDYTILYLSAISGIISIFFVFLIARKLYDKRIGLFSAMLLAFSSYHIHYSRSGFPAAVSVLFALAGFYLYIVRYHKITAGLTKAIFALTVASGFLLGYAITLHFNLIFFVTTVIILECIIIALNKKIILRQKIMLGLIFVVSIFIPILLFELSFRLAKFYLAASGLRSASTGLPYAFSTYFEELRQSFSPGVSGGMKFTSSNPLFYGKIFFLYENPLVWVFSIFGLFLLLKKIDLLNVFMLGLIVVPFGIFSFYGYQVPRSIAIIIPFMCLPAGLSFSRIFSDNRLRIVKAMVISIILNLLLGIVKSGSEVMACSHYSEAVEYVKGKGGGLISSTPANATFYLGKESVYPSDYFLLNYEELNKMAKDNIYRYVLLDMYSEADYNRGSILNNLIEQKKVSPVFEIKYSIFPFLYEIYTFAPVQKRIMDRNSIKVYELKDIL